MKKMVNGGLFFLLAIIAGVVSAVIFYSMTEEVAISRFESMLVIILATVSIFAMIFFGKALGIGEIVKTGSLLLFMVSMLVSLNVMNEVWLPRYEADEVRYRDLIEFEFETSPPLEIPMIPPVLDSVNVPAEEVNLVMSVLSEKFPFANYANGVFEAESSDGSIFLSMIRTEDSLYMFAGNGADMYHENIELSEDETLSDYIDQIEEFASL